MLGESYFYSPFVNSKWYFADIGNAEQASWFLLGTLMAREALQDGDIASTHIASTHIASTITSWTSLSSSIAAAAGKAVTLTLSTPFDMAGFQLGSSIDIGDHTAQTSITIVGNGAVFDAGGKDRFFGVSYYMLVMSNVTMQNGWQGGGGYGGGAIYVNLGGTVILSDCTFSGNTAPYDGGAIYITSDSDDSSYSSTVTLSNCIFSGNTVPGGNAGGALYFDSHSTGLFKNCSLLGTVSPKNNDIARDTTANVTFACANGEVGTSVQMSGAEITKLPSLTCTIASWTALTTSITAAAGKTATLTLSATFDMGTMQDFREITISTPRTHITIIGNGVIFDGQRNGRFFTVGKDVWLVMSNVTLTNGNAVLENGGAIFVSGTITLSSCSFSGNEAWPGGSHGGYKGGAIYIDTGATIILSSCSFSGNTAGGYPGQAGGALYFAEPPPGARGILGPPSSGLLKNCSLLGNVSPASNDIERADTTANVTFACADGLIGPAIQMTGTEITKLPVLTCSAPKYSCDGLTGICRPDQSGVYPSKQACSSGCTAQPTPAPCQVPRNCGDKNKTTVCGHTFKGCEFTCDFCCSPLYVLACEGCTEAKCKPLPPLPPPVTTKYACITTPSYHCVEFSSGTYHSATDCEKDCPPKPLVPSPAAHGHSA
jgi:predicted outer membrane repeat protein